MQHQKIFRRITLFLSKVIEAQKKSEKYVIMTVNLFARFFIRIPQPKYPLPPADNFSYEP